MENKKKEFDDVMAIEIAFMMGKNGDMNSVLDRIREIREESGCFSF